MKKFLTCTALSGILLSGCSFQPKIGGIVKVNDTVITKSEFNKRFDQEINNSVFKNFGGADNFLKSEENVMYRIFRDKVIHELIVKSLIDEEIKKRGVWVYAADMDGKPYYETDMSGAAAMSTKAAMRSGVGLATLATTERLVTAFIPSLLECTMFPLKENDGGTISKDNAEKLVEVVNNYTALLVGCGMGNNDDTKTIVETIIKTAEKSVVIDADGINVLSKSINILKESKADIILTPHIGEFARLVGLSIDEVKNRRFGLARDFATQNNVTVVLKDSTTVIATPDGSLFVNCNANSGLSKGGSGDVLAGIISSLCAQGYSPVNAAVVGVYLHMTAAEIATARLGEHGVLATDVIYDIAFAFKKFEK